MRFKGKIIKKILLTQEPRKNAYKNLTQPLKDKYKIKKIVKRAIGIQLIATALSNISFAEIENIEDFEKSLFTEHTITIDETREHGSVGFVCDDASMYWEGPKWEVKVPLVEEYRILIEVEIDLKGYTEGISYCEENKEVNHIGWTGYTGPIYI